MRFIGRRFLMGAVAVAAMAAATSAEAGFIERDLTAPSPILGHPIRYNLYKPSVLPPEGARWPVLYLLHGGGPGEADWLDAGALAEAMDHAIASGAMPPTVVVMPIAGDSWYVDNPDPGGAGAMKTALTHDLVHAIDARLPTAACRQARAVGGLSTGGYGALLFAFTEPRAFGAAFSLSGSISPPIGPQMKARLKKAQRLYDGAFGVPFQAARFNNWNLFPRAARIGVDGAPDPAIYLAAGDHDLGGAIQGASELHLALLRHKIDSTLRIEAGRHDWAFWRRALPHALKWLGGRINSDCGAAGAAVATAKPPAAD